MHTMENIFECGICMGTTFHNLSPIYKCDFQIEGHKSYLPSKSRCQATVIVIRNASIVHQNVNVFVN